MSTPTVVTTITDGLGSMSDNVLPIAAAGLAVGGLVLAVTKGWRLARRFVG